MSRQLTAVVVGAGHRALTYASYAREFPEALKIVGVADPVERRREQVARAYDLPRERCFTTAEELAARPKFADFAINGTMDHHHVPTSLPLIEDSINGHLMGFCADRSMEEGRVVDVVFRA